MRISDWSSDVCSSDRSDEGRLWASLAKAQDAAGFCQAWLDLQCGRTRGATTALILLQGSEGSFGPAAAWPSGPQNHPHLRAVAEQAQIGRAPRLNSSH